MAVSMIEIVARAICQACDENPDHPGDCRGNAFRWEDYKVAAVAAIEAVAKVSPCGMGKYYAEIPSEDGLYWYYANGQDPEPVKIDAKRYGEGKFKGFNGRIQAWLDTGEYLVGPQAPATN